MTQYIRLVFLLVSCVASLGLSAQQFKADRLKQAVQVLGLQLHVDSLLPDTTLVVRAKDGNMVCLRTNPMCEVEHVGIPLFNDVMRLLQPSPVYDFLEFAVLNKKYRVTPNQLYLSKVIFKHGSWDTLLKERLTECQCAIENREDKLYIVSWLKDEKEIVSIGIPVEYELLNNDTRRNMERTFINELENTKSSAVRPDPSFVSEASLSIYGTEGLFVIPGKSYIVDLLNQNVYYKLTTVYETADTIINKKPVTMRMEAVQPIMVVDSEFPGETFANLMMCNDASVPDVTLSLDFHLSNYHRRQLTIPMSQLRTFCQQQGSNMFFAYNGSLHGKTRGILIVSNPAKGYNHLFSLNLPTKELTSATPTVQADIYLYIPPISKEKLFGTAPTKKSGANFKLP